MSAPQETGWMHRVERFSSAPLHSVASIGEGPTLLLLHGVTRCWRDWEPLWPELIRDWRVVALDHPGHGESARTPGAYRVTDYASRASAFVRAHFSSPVVIFGHSLGAMVALQVAAECPEIIAGVVLEDPPFHTMGRDIAATSYRAQFVGMQEVARRGGDLETLVDALAEMRLPSPNGEVRFGDTRDRATLRFNAECLAQVDPEIFSPLVEATWLEDYDHPALWPRVQCPLLLLQGDPRTGGALTNTDADLAERTARNCHRIRFDRIGHQIHRTDPMRVASELRQWARDFALLP